ncbi:hypothetical protein CC80DRAFT_568554 [Byssothecium circinans]|uniref:CFEM domain-containing protein n=1 Tax=Byssothecium circinans TaxID=147558 RepID=A0A6A5TQN6_9PLEO|nr:hypothetical protein CC80DRAFT_568554 [Byssothecium circinans]
MSAFPRARQASLCILLLTFHIDISFSIPHTVPPTSNRQSPAHGLALLPSKPSPLPDPSPEHLLAEYSSIATPLAARAPQSSLSRLQIPNCALACYIATLTDDGCASETDFECHCSTGNVLGRAKSCIQKACPSEAQNDAESKMRSACKDIGVIIGGGGGGDNQNDGNSSQDGSSAGSGQSTPSMGASTTEGSGSTSSGSSASTSAPDTSNMNTTPAPSPTSKPSLSSPRPSRTSTSLMPTDTPLALLPQPRPLSTAAKAGISVSVTVFATGILVAIFLYIRRLKRDLALAKAAARVPESVWRASIETSTPNSGVSRRRSWASTSRGRGKRRSWYGGGGSASDSPVSPLSPHGVSMAETMEGVLKKKRGQVLSVVVEEDDSRSSVHRVVHEPVPGQKEGLVDPLELDGEYTGIVELPTSITPRARSMERSRERGTSVGESSRPSTGVSAGALEKIDERQGV